MSISTFAPLLFQGQAAVPTFADNALGLVITVGAFLLMLFILVVVHELGHFLTAVWMGIRVEEFGVGYPPRMATLFERNGVKYTLNWLPLGGFVRFGGEDNSLYGTGSLAAARPWRKIPVMVAGPLMNLLLAMLIFGIIFATTGVPVPTGAQRIGAVFDDTPAAAAGLQPEDEILSLAGEPVADGTSIGTVAEANRDTPIPVTILRDGEELTLTVTPGPWTTPSGEQRDVGLGISYAAVINVEQVGLGQAMVTGVTYTWDLLQRMLEALARLPASIGGLFTPNTPSVEEPIGPVGIARATGEVIQRDGGMLAFWNLTAILSLNLFLLNLLPIPALDGSHILFSLVEWLRGGKKVPPEKEALVHAVGFAALMGLMLVITVNDVVKAIQGIPVLGG